MRVRIRQHQVYSLKSHLENALFLALRYSLSSQDAVAVLAHFVHFVAIVFKRRFIV